MASKNPGLVVRIAANTDELKKNLAEAKSQIEGLRPSMEKLQQQWTRNAERVAQDAHNITAAYAAMGDGVTLSARDAAAALKKLDLGMDQLRASGQPIPALMQRTADELRKVATAAQSAGTATAPVESLTSKLKGLAGTLGLTFGAAAVVSGIKTLIGNAVDYAESISDLSAKMDVSKEAAQRWKFAAEQSGASLDDVDKAVRKLSVGLDGGDKSVKMALDRAGLSFDAIRAMKPEQAFTEASKAIASIEDPMTQARVALELFGKAGAELLPALRNGFLDVADSVSVMSDATINRLDEAKDAWERLGNQATVATGELISAAMRAKEWQDLATLNPAAMRGVAMDAAQAFSDLEGMVGKAQRTFNSRLVPAVGKSTEEILALMEATKQATPATNAGATAHDRAASSVRRHVKEIEIAIQKIPMASNAFATLKNVMRDMGTLMGNRLSNAPVPTVEIPVRVDPLQIIKDIQHALIMAGKSQNLAGASAGIGKEVGKSLRVGIVNALGDLSAVILSAVQGGGNVGEAVGVSLGTSIGAGLGGAAGAFFGGPAGKLLGEKLGGMLGAIGGKAIAGMFSSKGRDDVKAFASQMGGFDALRQKMVALGVEGERLWINLTQRVGKGDTAAAAKAIKEIEDAFTGLDNKLKSDKEKSKWGFPTKAELDQAAADAGDMYTRMRDSGLFTASTLEQAWQEWQDALIASGNEGAAALKKIEAEMKTLQAAIEEELPEYDAEGVRIYGVIEQQNIDRLAKLEAEKAKIIKDGILEKMTAEEESAKAAEASAKKAFDAAADRAKDLDGRLRRLFEAGYDIPIRFQVGPGGPTGHNAGGTPTNGPQWSPLSHTQASGGGGGATTTVQVVINNPSVRRDSDIRDMTRQVALELPKYLGFVGA
jgi:hypothetical protein